MKKLLMIILTFSILSVFAQDRLIALKVGDKAPYFMVKDHTGDMVSLKKMTKKGKVIIMFYRGAWCPYCNKYMS